MKKDEVDLEKDGVRVNGVIVDCKLNTWSQDDEFTEFRIKYSFKYQNQEYFSNDHFVLNTAHIDWASRGQLNGFPKIKFSSHDVFRETKTGKNIEVLFLAEKPETGQPIYSDILYQAAEIV